MEFKDYYSILGVNEKADDKEIKTAYRKLARKYHPDVSKEKDADERFKEVGEAYEVLKDSEKRAEYDQLRKYGGQQGGQFRPPPDWEPATHFYEGSAEHHFSDFFESLFGEPREKGPHGRPLVVVGVPAETFSSRDGRGGRNFQWRHPAN